jgi:hypothetical protein
MQQMVHRSNDAPVTTGQILRIKHMFSSRHKLVVQLDLFLQESEAGTRHEFSIQNVASVRWPPSFYPPAMRRE